MSSKGRPYRTLRVGGYEILVGKGGRENEVLTFEVAASGDLWLHVGGGTPGSHVVIRNPGGEEVPEAVVRAAASAAAWYSQARSRGSLEVHVCRVADVRKPKNAPLGRVEISRFKKLHVTASLPETDDSP
jgi:predicted ribosome quality control (RQC) complex YloA/Tae2 family protein